MGTSRCRSSARSRPQLGGGGARVVFSLLKLMFGDLQMSGRVRSRT